MSRGRTSIKNTANAAWKDKLREDCLQRLDAARTRLLDTARHARSGVAPAELAGAPDAVQSALHDIIAQSTAHLQAENGAPTPPQAPGNAPGRALAPAPLPIAEDDDGFGDVDTKDVPSSFRLPDRFRAPQTLQIGGGSGGGGAADFPELSPADYEDLMRALEASLYADMLQEEAEYLESLERAEADYLAEAHFGGGDADRPWSPGASSSGGEGGSGMDVVAGLDEDAVVCPVCSEGVLVQRRGVVRCRRCRLRLDLSGEGLRLQDLRERLAAVLEEHGMSRCWGQTVFSVEGEGAGGVGATLMMRCATCGALEVVI